MDKYANFEPFTRDESLNDFSYWFPKVSNCGLKVPKTVIVPVPEEIWKGPTFYMESYDEDMKTIHGFVEEKVYPVLQEAKLHGPLFIKNSRYSGKFNAASNCFCHKYQLADHIANIMYDAICCEAGGENEVVIRERISYDRTTIPCIYDGLPLRPEFRVFYDFDEHKPIFTVNYWDYDYVRPHLYDLTDIIVFDAMREKQKDTFAQYKDIVQDMVADAMKNVSGLEGPWSVDIMMKEYPYEGDAYKLLSPSLLEDGSLNVQEIAKESWKPEFYLIDMALAERSSYWEKRLGCGVST